MGAPKLTTSSLTSKYQATIPSEIRARLKLKAGDKITFTFSKSGDVILQKATELDLAYLSSVETTLSEWNTPEDEAAFENL